MTEPAEPFAWLPSARVQRWLQVDPADDVAAVVEDCRVSAASWCEDQRRDLVVVTYDVDCVVLAETFTPTERVVQAAVLATSRLYARRSSPAGLASYGEFGAAEVLRLDPDVSRLLGVGRYARPAVG